MLIPRRIAVNIVAGTLAGHVNHLDYMCQGDVRRGIAISDNRIAARRMKIAQLRDQIGALHRLAADDQWALRVGIEAELVALIAAYGLGLMDAGREIERIIRTPPGPAIDMVGVVKRVTAARRA